MNELISCHSAVVFQAGSQHAGWGKVTMIDSCWSTQSSWPFICLCVYVYSTTLYSCVTWCIFKQNYSHSGMVANLIGSVLKGITAGVPNPDLRAYTSPCALADKIETRCGISRWCYQLNPPGGLKMSFDLPRFKVLFYKGQNFSKQKKTFSIKRINSKRKSEKQILVRWKVSPSCQAFSAVKNLHCFSKLRDNVELIGFIDNVFLLIR